MKTSPYSECKVYGPYTNRQNMREHVVLIYPGGQRTSVSYPKFLVELHRGERIKKDEIVHHIDGDISNNSLKNLEVKTRQQHSRGHSRYLRPRTFKCPLCEKQFVLEGRGLHYAIDNRNKGKVGPFCGRRCAGKYGKEVQLKCIKKLAVLNIQPTYLTHLNNVASEELSIP